jgi:RIO kinase 1
MSDKELNKFEERIERFLIREKDADDYKISEGVFDDATLRALYKLVNRGIIKLIGGPVSTGKEANVFYAIGDLDQPKYDLAIKIYRIATSDFKRMNEYLIGDPRFRNIKHDKKSIVLAWTRKEFHNLQRAMVAGVRVPTPIATERNVLVMEFIGEDEVPAPRMKDIGSEIKDTDFNRIVEYMSLLYKKASLVHSDLSEFNILYDGAPVFIDMGQSVTLEHPNAEDFLERDVRNIVSFFRKWGASCPHEEEVLERVRN